MIKSLHLGPLVLVWNRWLPPGVSWDFHVSRALGVMATLQIHRLFINFDIVR